MDKRHEHIELSDFLSREGHDHVEISGSVHGLTEYQLPDGTVTYSGVLSNEDGVAVQFRGGNGIGTSGKSIPDQIIESTQRLAILRYSAETSQNVYLGVFNSPLRNKDHDLALVSYVLLCEP